MSEQLDQEAVEPDDTDSLIEYVEALPVLSAEVRPTEVIRPPVTLVQSAALAATGFVAGAATAAVLGRHFGRRLAARSGSVSRRAPTTELLEVVSSRSFLVDVHVLGRRGDHSP